MYIHVNQVVEAAREAPEVIQHSFGELDLSKLEGVRFHTWSEYELYLGIYRGLKAAFAHELDAFLKLWLLELIEVEEWYESDMASTEAAKSIYEHFFLKDVADFTLQTWGSSEAEEFANQCITDKTKKVIEGIAVYEQRYGVEDKIGGPGIYKLGLKRLEEEMFFMKIEGVQRAVEIRYDDSWAGYRTLFLETEDEYILLCE
ncbi:hypothetical protein [Gorillibacterium sp. CAU 1737]|uniref:hypothetical protein n=1 Tax=Gorillibacterium sp. CAU 1737 TaxID=3140362 RepID=UPI003260874E